VTCAVSPRLRKPHTFQVLQIRDNLLFIFLSHPSASTEDSSASIEDSSVSTEDVLKLFVIPGRWEQWPLSFWTAATAYGSALRTARYWLRSWSPTSTYRVRRTAGSSASSDWISIPVRRTTFPATAAAAAAAPTSADRLPRSAAPTTTYRLCAAIFPAATDWTATETSASSDWLSISVWRIWRTVFPAAAAAASTASTTTTAGAVPTYAATADELTRSRSTEAPTHWYDLGANGRLLQILSGSTTIATEAGDFLDFVQSA